MENKLSRKEFILVYSIIVLILILTAIEIVALILWVPGTWTEKLAAVSVVIGLYGLATALFAKSKALKGVRDTVRNLN